MIAWREVGGGVRPQPIEILYRRLALTDVLSLEARARGDPLVLIAPTVHESVVAHLRTSDDELGGLLIGEAFHATGEAECIAAIRVLEALASDEFSSSAVALRMGTGVWSKACARLDAEAGHLVVGWYHSHPHIGAFFSTTDQRTQRAFFAHAYSLGWVIDPYQDDANLRERMYLGADSTEVPPASIVLGPA